ncbi:polyprenyl synthetase [Streptomyces griseoaurantiacus]|uniref:Polyprenyl synthetase n=1 Tax=Streptomyces griseoaurantiacus TaxID=68213 RepID=A0A7W2DRX2_9ACTN|nr:polyprenyl synthetase [Streptomyces griseoaurantiacus]MBA5221894.1 polyprenyl synthetase [Streptomyces griseoaurantiacus]
MTPTARPHQPRDERVVLLAAGLAELAVSTVGSVAGKMRGLLHRSDGADLARDAERDLMARGRLLLDRFATAPPAHLEVLAQHVLVRRPGSGDDV